MRDEDVLDTWFSSALWPFSTLGWPDETPELKRFYPTSTLVTGFDIIFFWVARMMMMGLHFMTEVPFHDVYIHRLVRDASGAKMSKSKGNVVDPLGVIDEFGADALRFTLARNVAPGHDIRLGPQDVENNRNFATKLWNAARFVEFNGAARVEGFDPKSAKETLNRWIAHETAKAAAEITRAIETYGFSEAAGAAYRFVWNVYCDWYVELSKPLLTGPDGAAKDETRAMAAWALDEILKLLHPFMPFITEELWAVTAEQGPKRSSLLALSDWPQLEGLADDKAEAEIGWVIELITAIRSIRAEMNITVPIPLVLAGASAETQGARERWADFIKRLARVSDISSRRSGAAGLGATRGARRGGGAAAQGRHRSRRRARAARPRKWPKADADIARVDAKLGNEKFVANAPEDIVEEEKEKREEAVGAQRQDRRGAGAAQGRHINGELRRDRRVVNECDVVKIFLAGAGGVIGRRLTPLLHRAGHVVAGTTRSADKAAALRALGAEPVVVDVFDAAALTRAVVAAAPQVVIHQLTDLPFAPNTPQYQEGLARNARLRIEGTRNLVAAAKAAGVKRLIAQSIAFVYAPGRGRAGGNRSARHAMRRAGAQWTASSRSSRRRSQCRKASCCATASCIGPGTWFGDESAGGAGRACRCGGAGRAARRQQRRARHLQHRAKTTARSRAKKRSVILVSMPGFPAQALNGLLRNREPFSP